MNYEDGVTMANRPLRILPSVASADQMNLESECSRLLGTKYLHIDIEDGNFLPNITFGMKTTKAIMNLKQFAYDIHLLVKQPQDYIDELLELKPRAIAFHIESVDYPLLLLNKIKADNIKAGLALNFKTDISQVTMFERAIDYVIIMTAEPDYLNNSFNPLVIQKIKKAREILADDIEIWVDGAVDETNFKALKEAGANGFVMGRAIWSKERPKEFIETLLNNPIKNVDIRKGKNPVELTFSKKGRQLSII